LVVWVRCSGAKRSIATYWSKIPPQFAGEIGRFLDDRQMLEQVAAEFAFRISMRSPRSEQVAPKFLGNLDDPFAMFQSDSGRTACVRPLRRRSVAPGMQKAEAPKIGLTKLNSMAFGLAVYTSQCGLLQHRARLASGCWSGSTGRGSHPQVPLKGFKVADYISFSFPKLACRNCIDLREFSGSLRRSLRGISGWIGGNVQRGGRQNRFQGKDGFQLLTDTPKPQELALNIKQTK
jgi:hypothetical protein